MKFAYIFYIHYKKWYDISQIYIFYIFYAVKL